MAKIKKITVPVVIKTEQPESLWTKTKAWFYHSESVVLAYVVSAFGAVTALVGSLNLSPFWSLFQSGTEFTSKQLTWMGVGVLGSGIAAYIARVRGTKEVDGRLLPTAE